MKSHTMYYTEDDIFIGGGSENRFQRQKRRQETIDMLRESRSKTYQTSDSDSNEDLYPIPDDLAMEKSKLHISLSYEDYKIHKDAIRSIVIKCLQEQDDTAIAEFKMVALEKLEEKLQELIDTAEELKRYKSDESQSRDFNKFPLLDKLVNSYQLMFRKSLPTTNEEIIDLEISIRKRIESLERFRDGDQFTLYLPKKYSKRKVKDLCDKVNTYMIENNIVSNGNKSDVAISVTPQINMRLEYFEAGNDKKRIDAIKSDDEPQARRYNAQSALKKNYLYKYLSNNFKKSLKNAKPTDAQLQAELLNSVNALVGYGEILKNEGSTSKGEEAIKLAKDINEQVTAYINKTGDPDELKTNFSNIISEGRKSMGKWKDRKLKDIISHILIGATLIGLAVILGKKFLSKSKSGFFNSTKRQDMLDHINDNFQKVLKR